MSDSQTVSASYLWGGSEDLGKGFWQQWQQYRDYLYRCCIKWMGGNPTDAEDALSRAMLKAWEKVQKYAAGEISNFKAWLTTLTRNLCVDIYRERSRGANRVEDIEGYASRLRETFSLHFYNELSYPEIVQQQEISYDNVCKRISQTRKILREELRGYFIEEEGTDTDKSVPPTATESAIGEMSQGNAPVEATVGETVTFPVAVEEVESFGDEDAIEVAPDVRHSESASAAATNEGKLEVKSDGCRCVEAVLCERLLAPILVLAQFDEETGSWGNSCLTVLWRQQQLMVGKVAGEFVRSSRSPPWYCFPNFQSLAKSLSGMMMRGKFLLSQTSSPIPRCDSCYWYFSGKNPCFLEFQDLAEKVREVEEAFKRLQITL
jgi:RNA polymerase sigma-70 factor (ECF subfamily)